jgi:hypothetical protein
MSRSIPCGVILACLLASSSATRAQEDPILIQEIPGRPKPAETIPEIRPPATLPTTQPVSPKKLAAIREMLGQLASEDGSKREKARIDLMALQRSDLYTLREAIRLTRPLQPSQAAVLPDIVSHVYLSGDVPVTDDTPGTAFLGIRMAQYLRPEDRPLLSLEKGVAVVGRIPGFCAFRMLQDGDIILSIVEHQSVELNKPDDLIDAIKAVRAGQAITFELIRHGRIIKVPITLDRRPPIPELEQYIAERARIVADLWEREFAPILEDKVS